MTARIMRGIKVVDAILIGIALVSLVGLGLHLAGVADPLLSLVTKLRGSSRVTTSGPVARIGDKLSLQGLPAGRVLVVARSQKCVFCEASAAFHKELIAASIRRHLPVIIVIPAQE